MYHLVVANLPAFEGESIKGTWEGMVFYVSYTRHAKLPSILMGGYQASARQPPQHQTLEVYHI